MPQHQPGSTVREFQALCELLCEAARARAAMRTMLEKGDSGSTDEATRAAKEAMDCPSHRTLAPPVQASVRPPGP